MDLNEYQQAALRTESIVEKLSFNPRLVSKLLQIFVVNADLLDAVKKQVYYKNSKKFNEIIDGSLERINDLVRDVRGEATYYRNTPEDVLVNPRIFHGILGMATEAGELAEILVDAIDGIAVDYTNLQEELNDSNWYQAILHDEGELNWEEGLARNIAKLKARYPEKFTTENADKRDLEKERKILEGKND